MKSKLILITLFLISCQEHQNSSERGKREIINADIAMSDMASKEGFNNAILFYADTNIIKFQVHEFPVIGKAAFAKSFNKNTDLKTISWKPVKAEVSQSGDLGYTWGNWKLLAKDTTYYGNYFTAWKKQKDGTWKVTLDGGNATPKPQ